MKKNDFVITIRPINGIDIDSVGIIESTFQEGVDVYFIGKSKNVTAPVDALRVIDVTQTGDEHTCKICNVCHIIKPVEEFAINQTNAQGLKRRRPTCKICRKIIDGKSIKSTEKKRLNAERQPDRTIFVCPICNKETVIGVTANVVRDHDHSTGMGREWICDSCNTGLGRFKDDIVILKVAIEYLKRHQSEDSDMKEGTIEQEVKH